MPPVTDDEIERLVSQAAAADDAAWHALWSAIESPLSRFIAQPRFLGRLGQREDDRRNIVVAVMARLRADSFGRLRQYLDAKTQNPRLRFMSWLRVVAKRVGIDYMEQPHRPMLPGSDSSDAGVSHAPRPDRPRHP